MLPQSLFLVSAGYGGRFSRLRRSLSLAFQASLEPDRRSLRRHETRLSLRILPNIVLILLLRGSIVLFS